jgi:transcriptional regulator with XRE-family HTH domain
MVKTEHASTLTPEKFCCALKAARERKGITLAEIAEATKIPAYLMEGLERCDLRRWPKGLFRRSFFRDYARMIGVSVTEAVAEFVRLFPDEDGDELSKVVFATNAPGQPASPRLSAFAAAIKRGAEAISRVCDNTGMRATADAAEAEQQRPWVSDARRVGPAPSSKFRVRIKVPK